MARTYIEGHFYSDSLKEQVVREYQSGYSMNYLRGKYGIGGANTIRRWLYAKGLRPIPRKNYLAVVKPSTPNESDEQNGNQADVAQLQQQLKAAQRQLEDARIKSEMLERLIELAEQRHHISIRKKGGTR